MSERLDRVLDVLDVGLQSSTEGGFGTDLRGRCARCQRTAPALDGDLCEPCRQFLLGDVDDDPRAQGLDTLLGPRAAPDHPARGRRPAPHWASAAAEAAEDFERSMRQVLELMDADDDQVAQMAERAREVSRVTGVHPQAVANGFAQALRSEHRPLEPAEQGTGRRTLTLRIHVDARQALAALRAAAEGGELSRERIRGVLREAIRISPTRSGRLR